MSLLSKVKHICLKTGLIFSFAIVASFIFLQKVISPL